MNIKDVIDAVKGFSGAQWAAIFAIVGMGIYGYSWMENRYANKDVADRTLDHVIRVDSKISGIITTQYSKEQAADIFKSAKDHEDQMRKYLETRQAK